ncbi:alanine racemase [Alloalcanivorax profundimaris]|uniref:Alanine racemase n=1 Tax=Alloalcanivorax profundimaris TaxID=2735259 RepID=A0ABS0ARG8_9GAMM|nr:alanine racemase [Alloalcanivorax profundimaris]MBF1802387.1 alanine racemase [Alloalcanivorax profundimaris]MBF5056529.1 alanine racemase [Alloalcanivorax profundimaris]
MRGTLLELRPGALADNARRARALAGKARVFAMVKADGYGHGLGLAARALAHQVDGLGVAVMEEAQALRHLGLAHPLLVAEGFFDAEELALAARLHAEVVVHSPWQVDLLAARPQPVGVWLKVNTGMNRLGMAPDLARAQAARLRALKGVRLLGVMTHFAGADLEDDPLTPRQLELARALAEELGVPLSAANSAALIRYPEARVGRVRPGIMLYGSSPFPWRAAADLDLRVTQRFSARLIAINPVQPGDSVGYGATWTATAPGRIGVVAVGYGDGYPRHAPNGTPLAVNGQRTRLAGRVSMDMITVDLDGIDARVGDEVELWGDVVSVDEVAAACGTISYELFCQVTARPVRVITES